MPLIHSTVRYATHSNTTPNGRLSSTTLSPAPAALCDLVLLMSSSSLAIESEVVVGVVDLEEGDIVFRDVTSFIGEFEGWKKKGTDTSVPYLC